MIGKDPAGFFLLIILISQLIFRFNKYNQKKRMICSIQKLGKMVIWKEKGEFIMIYSNGSAIISLGQEIHIKFICTYPATSPEDVMNPDIENKIILNVEEVSHLVMSIESAKALRDGLTENIAKHEEKLNALKGTDENESR